jgi:hypothetical protein
VPNADFANASPAAVPEPRYWLPPHALLKQLKALVFFAQLAIREQRNNSGDNSKLSARLFS